MTSATDVPVESVGSDSAPLCEPIRWRCNYRAALEEAEEAGSMVAVWFFDPQKTSDNEDLERDVFRQCDVATLLSSCVPVKLSIDASHDRDAAAEEASVFGDEAGASKETFCLLDHPAFEEMLGLPGIALIDMRDRASPQFHHVVSVFPFSQGPITRQQFMAMLQLPDGSLTQRTLLWAVWTHAEHPQSASAEASPELMQEAASHADYQARIRLQGHHHWDARFNRINGKLPRGLVAQEVCAESWPNQRLVEAAQECVHSWRQSSGHWDAVSTRHPLFGYDMKRGANGIWYATGIFGRRR